jgi:hypothetical protein
MSATDHEVRGSAGQDQRWTPDPLTTPEPGEFQGILGLLTWIPVARSGKIMGVGNPDRNPGSHRGESAEPMTHGKGTSMDVEQGTDGPGGPRWQRELKELADRQVKLPPMRRFRHQRFAGGLLLVIVVSAITGNLILVVFGTVLFCALPMVKGPRR